MKRYLYYLWNLWPPFWGAGIAIDHITPDFMKVRVKLKRRPWNRNIVGTQFGGSIYAMTDPFYMTMLLVHLGRDYIVWDKAAHIRFRKPGKSTLFAEFELTERDLEGIRDQLKTTEKMDWEKMVLVKDGGGNIIAEIKKVIYIRCKNS